MNFNDFTQRLAQVDARGIGVELVALVACVALAWAVSKWFGRDQPKDSIWFGESTFDGLLFPLLALVLTDLARRVVIDFQTVLVLRIAVPVFLSLAVIRLFARVLRAVFPASNVVRLIERTISWLAWIAAVLWIVGLLPPVLTELDQITLAFGKTRVSLQTIFQGVLSAGLVLVISLWISSTIEKRILREAVTDLSMRKVASNAVRAFLLLVGLLFALSAVGVDLTALSVLGGALGVGLGFGLQKLAANYVSGFVILLERSIRIGDNVKVDTFEGRITDIKTRYTLIRAGNGREAIVPNESLITSRVENLSLADRKFNITTTIVVGYESNVAQVQTILCDAAKAQPRVMTDPEPVAFLMNFAPDGLEFTLNFWVADPDKGKDNLRSAINIAILDGLRGAGIDIPYPQRVVRVESLPDGLAQPPNAVL
ncbi:mechanosensitive ion channel family protein [Variovorax sp. YR566]|uniref:mechanosensitive ion channel family protein n=1 Tax=Variovorax sp. YR566 TaxID=3450237 RepID=UPI003F7DFB97